MSFLSLTRYDSMGLTFQLAHFLHVPATQIPSHSKVKSPVPFSSHPPMVLWLVQGPEPQDRSSFWKEWTRSQERRLGGIFCKGRWRLVLKHGILTFKKRNALVKPSGVHGGSFSTRGELHPSPGEGGWLPIPEVLPSQASRSTTGKPTGLSELSSWKWQSFFCGIVSAV